MELTDKELVLRQFKDSDSKRIAELCNNRKIWDNVRDFLPFPYTEKDAVDFINSCKSEIPPVTFVIEFDRELAGCIGFVPQKDIYRLSAEIGYWIGDPYWGRGIATKAVKLLAGYGFKNLDLVRIYSGVFDYNLASQRVLEKAGFKLEGIFEKSVIKNGIIRDEYRYALIRP